MAKFKLHKEDAIMCIVLIVFCLTVIWLYSQYAETQDVITRMKVENAQDKARLDYIETK